MADNADSKKKKLGKYTVIRRIGQGSAANIYLASQEGLDRPLVIKELLPQYGSNAKIISRFKREAKIISRLSHDTIVHIYDTWVRTRSYYIAMEYVQGLTLKEIVEKTGFVPPKIAGMILYQICRGLTQAHANGVVHRDLKPANIMVSESGHVKILDFGIAHFQLEDGLTSQGALLGTYSYMSPEQALGRKTGPASDIFSLGILFYELLTGFKPFVRDERADVLEKIIHKRYTPPGRLNPAVPACYGRIVRKALRKKPGRRFHSAERIKHALEKRLKRYSLDHQAVLKAFLANLKPKTPDPNYPPRFWRRAGYRAIHQSPKTYAALLLILLTVFTLEWRLAESGISLQRQWHFLRRQASGLVSRFRPARPAVPVGDPLPENGTGPEVPEV